MSDMKELQDAVGDWGRFNFPDSDDRDRTLIICEEAGELAHVILKQHQGIRPDSASDAHAQDAMGDIVIALMGLADARGWDLWEIVRDTSARVLSRNYRVDEALAGAATQRDEA